MKCRLFVLDVLDISSEQRLDRVLKERSSLDKQRQDKLISTISTTLSTAVKTKMDHLVRNEMKNLVIPSKCFIVLIQHIDSSLC